MNANEWVGYLASLLVLVTFCMQGMVSLRAVAITSNVAFIAYAALAGIGPVMLLHVLLLPMNLYRLFQALGQRRQHRATGDRVAPLDPELGPKLGPELGPNSKCTFALRRSIGRAGRMRGPDWAPTSAGATPKENRTQEL